MSFAEVEMHEQKWMCIIAGLICCSSCTSIKHV
jgi:hypothetical protein